MDSEIVAIYVVCDDVLRILGVRDDPQTLMGTAEIVAFSIIVVRLLGGTRSRGMAPFLGAITNVLVGVAYDLGIFRKF